MNHLTTEKLAAQAREIVIENEFLIDLPAEVIEQLQAIDENEIISGLDSSVEDLRSLLWSSIDNATSRDLDQIEYAESLPNGDIRLLVGIADVDAFVPKDSAIDHFAAQNTVSVYAGNAVFPMLPGELSNDLTSLLEGFDRLAVVTELIVRGDGDIAATRFYRALTRNYAKLTYEKVGAWLDGKSEKPEEMAKIPGLEEQVRLQQEAAARLYEFRKQNGALEFETIESAPVIEGERIIGIQSVETNSARRIIENFMIAANVEMAKFLEKQNFPTIRRVVETPERWEQIVEIAASYDEKLPAAPDSKALAGFLEKQKRKDPVHYPDLSLSIIKLVGSGDYMVQTPTEKTGGHFGLAVTDYTHSTAPNRRFSDLIVQRQVKAALENRFSPYGAEQLEQIAAQANRRESAAKKVERKVRKIMAAAVVMTAHVGESFEAIVTGKNARGTFARILRPPIDGRITEGEEKINVGDKITVKLLAADAEKGFIDFAKVDKK